AAHAEQRQGEKPPRAPKWRQDDDLQAPALLVPDPVTVGGDHGEGVISGRKMAVISRAAGAGVDPISIQSHHLILEPDVLRVDEAQPGIVNLEVIFPWFDAHSLAEILRLIVEAELFDD